MKRFVPLLITAIGGFVLIVSVFIPAMQSAGEVVATWFDVLASIAFILGGGNLLAVHLRKVSDRQAGWGYSVITLVSFLAMLWIGLFKIGTAPGPQSAYDGETFVALPEAAWPEVSVPGTIPSRGDGKPLPPSVRTTNPPQLTESSGQLRFRGWMTSAQRSDLLAYHPTLEWQSRVEELARLSGVSPRQLHRKFREVFGMSVQEFLTKTRVQAASDALLGRSGTGPMAVAGRAARQSGALSRTRGPELPGDHDGSR